MKENIKIKNGSKNKINNIIFIAFFVLVNVFLYISFNQAAYNSANNPNVVKKYIITSASIKKENGIWKTVGYTKSRFKNEDHKRIIAYTKKEPQHIFDHKNKYMLVKVFQKNNKYYSYYNNFTVN